MFDQRLEACRLLRRIWHLRHVFQRCGGAPFARRRAGGHQLHQQLREQVASPAAQAGGDQRAAQHQPQITLLFGVAPEDVEVAQVAGVAPLGGVAR
ncbi:MAG: hypothetical protein RMJ54_09695, partial [Roseiflexaceae bacterium]|nr:hypothetical protein [Roseiflexaceae bacterium]